jgi:hypothetical protein
MQTAFSKHIIKIANFLSALLENVLPNIYILLVYFFSFRKIIRMLNIANRVQ